MRVDFILVHALAQRLDGEALHALAILQAPLAPIQDSCLDFIDTLWTNRGGFYGSWADDHVDCEYTYYGLLALGHLTL